MPDINLTQTEADALVKMGKFRTDDHQRTFPPPGDRLVIPLVSRDKREEFMLDLNRGRINLAKVTYQNRARKVVVLMRLDIEGPPHENPDGKRIPCPHLHVYREGYGVKWAEPAPPDRYKAGSARRDLLDAFMAHCNVVDPPSIQMGLF